MTDTTSRTFASDFRQFFLRGLVVLLPSVLTLWIVVKAYQFVDTSVAQPINSGVQLAIINLADHWDALANVEAFTPTVDELDAVRQESRASGETLADEDVMAEARSRRIVRWWENKWYMNLIGLVVAVIIVYLAGRLLGGLIGRRLYRRIEKFITTLPVFKQVYPYVKQVVDFLFSDDQPIKFNRVGVVEYPRTGIWALGFMTGDSLKSVAETAGDTVTMFIPSSPTPFTGYTITVPRKDVIEVPISVDEAIRFTVSGGVLIPDHQKPDRRAETSDEDSAADLGLLPIPGSPDENESVPEDGAPPETEGS